MLDAQRFPEDLPVSLGHASDDVVIDGRPLARPAAAYVRSLYSSPAGYGLDVDVDESGDGVTITIVRTQPAEMPDFVKKLTGDTVKVKQTEKWSAPADDGSRRADVKVSIIGQPAEMLGTAVLESTGGGTSFTVSGDVTVKIPFIGKKIEPEVAKAIRGSLKNEVELGMTRL